MVLSAPTRVVFFIALILGLIGTIGTFVALPMVAGYTTYLLIVAFFLLVAGSMLSGL